MENIELRDGFDVYVYKTDGGLIFRGGTQNQYFEWLHNLKKSCLEPAKLELVDIYTIEPVLIEPMPINDPNFGG